jgi:prepilin-type N-terminal cleavage/methylation domain-containing protein
MRGFSLIEILIAVCVVSLFIGLTFWATAGYREKFKASVNVELRQVAIDQLYETHGITADEIWLQSAKAELTRRGMTGPKPLNRQTLAVYVDATGPYDPAFVVPDRYDPQTLQALGLDEPDLHR